MDQSLIIYTTQKLVFSRNVQPKLLNEPPFIGSYKDYKHQVKHHKQNEKLYAAQVQKIKMAKLPDPELPVMGLRGSNLNSQDQLHTGGMPTFKLFQCQNLVIHKMDYCDVVNQLLNVLILIFNKTDTMILSQQMLEHFQHLDELI